MNTLPIIALATVALGYFGAIHQPDDPTITRQPPQLTSYPAATQLSVQDLMERPPLSVDQPFCGSLSDVTETLARDFAESEQGRWVQGNDMAMQLWGSDLMGTWTLLHVGQDGIACVVSSGTGWSEGAVPADILAVAGV